MPVPVDDMMTALKTAPDEAAADLFAAVAEQGIDFTSRDSYFRSLLALPSPLRELYAALIFNTDVRLDGVRETLSKYDEAEFRLSLKQGYQLLHEYELLALIDEAIRSMSQVRRRPDG